MCCGGLSRKSTTGAECRSRAEWAPISPRNFFCPLVAKIRRQPELHPDVVVGLHGRVAVVVVGAAGDGVHPERFGGHELPRDSGTRPFCPVIAAKLSPPRCSSFYALLLTRYCRYSFSRRLAVGPASDQSVPSTW